MPFIIKKQPQPRRKLLQILEQLNITVLLDSKGDYLGEVAGVVCKKDGKNVIVLNPNIAPDVAKLTLTHELAHLLLGHTLEDCAISREQQEFETESLGFILYSFLTDCLQYLIKGGVLHEESNTTP